MKCDNCKKESQWLEIVGSDFICHKCINKHKVIGFILRTHINTFKAIIKQLKIKNFQEMMKLERKDIEKSFDLKKYGIVLKTTNIVEID